MATPTAVPQWQTAQGTIGGRYNLVYVADGSYPIPTATASEFRTNLSVARGNSIAVESATLLGRVMSVNVRLKMSASLLQAFSGIVATGPDTTRVTYWKLINVYYLGTSTTSGGIPPLMGGTSDWSDALKRLLEMFSPAHVGEQVGKGINELVKPLILPAVIVVVGLYFAGKVSK